MKNKCVDVLHQVLFAMALGVSAKMLQGYNNCLNDLTLLLFYKCVIITLLALCEQFINKHNRRITQLCIKNICLNILPRQCRANKKQAWSLLGNVINFVTTSCKFLASDTV